MKTNITVDQVPDKGQRNTTYIKSSTSDRVQVIKNTPVYDSEGSWMMECVVTGRKFSPIQVPVHFLRESVCNGQAYKKLMEERKAARKAKRNNRKK